MLRLFFWVAGSIVVLLIAISGLILIPAIQTKLVNGAADLIIERTGLPASIGSVQLAFPKTVRVNEIFIGSGHEDTLFFSNAIKIDVALFPLLRKKVTVSYLQIDGVRGNLIRNPGDSAFNFNPLITAFSGKEKSEKKETKGNWNISLGRLELKDIRLDYRDHQDSTFIMLDLGLLSIHAKALDLANLSFDLENVALLNTSLAMHMSGSAQEKAKSPTTSKRIPLQVSMGEILLSNIAYELHIGQDKLAIDARVSHAVGHPKMIDLPAEIIQMKSVDLDGIEVALTVRSTTDSTSSEKVAIEAPVADYTFGNFNWDFLVERARIQNTSYAMDIGQKSDSVEGMDYAHMAFTDFNVEADSIFFNKNSAGALAHSMSVRELSGPQLNNLSGRFFMDNHGISARNVEMKTPDGYVTGWATLGYPALRKIGLEISAMQIHSDLRGYVATKEVLPFAPIIADIPFIKNVNGIQDIHLVTAGTLGDFEVREMSFSLDGEGYFIGSGAVKGLPSTNLDLSFAIDSLYLAGTALRRMASDNHLSPEYTLPRALYVKASGKHDRKNSELDFRLSTDLGGASIVINKADVEMEGVCHLDSLDLGKLLGQPMLGKLTMETDMTAKMNGLRPEELQTATSIRHFDFNEYVFSDININMDYESNEFDLRALSSDSALMVSLVSHFSLDDSIKFLQATADLINIDLQKLGMISEPFDISGDIDLTLNYLNNDDLNGVLAMKHTTLTKQGSSYFIEKATLKAAINENTSNLDFQSDIVDATLTGNTKIRELGDALIDQIDRHISIPDSLLNVKEFKFVLDIDWKKKDFIAGFLIEELSDFELSRCHASYDDQLNQFVAVLELPLIQYKNMVIDSLTFNIDSQSDSTALIFHIEKLSLDTAYMQNIRLESVFGFETVKLRFETHDSNDELKYCLHSSAQVRDSAITISINPDNLVVNHLPWQISADNKIRFDKNGIISSNAVMWRGDQKLAFVADTSSFRIQFEQFRVRNIIGIMEIDTMSRPVQGAINGYIAVETYPENKNITANLDLNDIKIKNDYLGNIHTDFKSGADYSEFTVLVTNDVNNINAHGYLKDTGNENQLNIITEYNIQDAGSFQPFLEDYITDLGGKISGRLAVSGTTNKPVIRGNMACEKLGGYIISANGAWTSTGGLAISDNVFRTNTFYLEDSKGHKLNVNGTFDLTTFSDPYYDVALQSDNFYIVDNEAPKENTLSGKLAMGFDISMKGHYADLTIKANLNINKETDAVYTMPGKELELINDQGIVAFADFNQPNLEVPVAEVFSIQDSISSLLRGINLTADLTVDPAANFMLVTDPNSGDFSEFNISGTLHYVYNNNLRGQLTGIIELKQGFYELSFYGLVKKRFDFMAGSTVNWAGDIMDGEINFSAKYTVKTNSVGLVSNQISSYEKAMYNQRLPYDVLLYVQNRISYPAISFGIDLPQSYRNMYPTLDSKLNSLNLPSMESERNKQVFALLVGGTFIPENPDISEGSSSQNFATTAAINSVNAIMTQQLNSLTGQFIKNVDIDMGVNTFDDYSSGNAQTKTQLDVKVSKNLFNDRVSAEVLSHINLDGSNNSQGSQSNAGMTEFAVSYKLTKTGNYRIKVFRENAYDIFDGEIQNSGIAFIFVREFDYFFRDNPKVIVPADTITNNQ